MRLAISILGAIVILFAAHTINSQIIDFCPCSLGQTMFRIEDQDGSPMHMALTAWYWIETEDGTEIGPYDVSQNEVAGWISGLTFSEGTTYVQAQIAIVQTFRDSLEASLGLE